MNRSNRCVVIAGADIENYDFVKSHFTKDDFFAYCDCGLRHMEKLGAAPDLIVGDFDSHENPHMDVETIVLPCEKDDTDTIYAVKTLASRGFDEFLIVGAIGNRFDHTLGNLSILLLLDSMGKKGQIVDDYSIMELCTPKHECVVEDTYSYFSTIALAGSAENVSIQDAKYPLKDGTIKPDYQYGISNEVAPASKLSHISLGKGRLLVVKVI